HRYVMSVVNPKKFFRQTRIEGSSRLVNRPPQGLREAIPVELFAIGEHFVLAVDGGDYKVWRRVAERRLAGDLTWEAGGVGAQDGPLRQSEILKNARKIWRSYLVSNTGIKETPTENGQVFAYRVSLNTEPLCRSGRLARDF